MEEIQKFISQVKLARKQSHQNLTLFPLLAPNGNKPDYLTLDQALKEEKVLITEVDELLK